MRLHAVAWVILLAATAARAVVADEASPVTEEALGVVSVGETYRRIAVSRVKGLVTLAFGEQPGEVRFLSFTADKAHEPLPVGVWSEGSTLRFEPTPSAASQAHDLHIDVPNGQNVLLDLEGTQVNVGGLPGRLEVHGKRLALTVRGVRGSAVLDLLGGTAVVAGVEKSLSVRGKDVDLKVNDMPAQVALELDGGKAVLSGVGGSVEAETEGTMLSIHDGGAVTVTAARGRVELMDVDGAELSLSGVPLTMTRVRGDARVKTDTEVRFTDAKGPVNIEGSGGAVYGSGSLGDVRVKTRDAEVALEHLSGSARVEGEGLKIVMKDVNGEIGIAVQHSEILVDGNHKPLSIENNDGNIVVRNTDAPVAVRMSGGTVALLGLRSSVELHADGSDAEVSFTLLSGEKDSVLENAGGGLNVQFPAGQSCRIEARSKGGKIESEFDSVKINADGTMASGLIGGAGGRTIRMDAGWNIVLTGPKDPS